jgi:hypothetical protein
MSHGGPVSRSDHRPEKFMNKGDRQSCPNPRNADENTTETAYYLVSKIGAILYLPYSPAKGSVNGRGGAIWRSDQNSTDGPVDI